MSHVCCKGIYTRPCEDCGYQLCPTSGHGQVASSADFICWDCAKIRKLKADKKDQERLAVENDQLRKRIEELEALLNKHQKEGTDKKESINQFN